MNNNFAKRTISLMLALLCVVGILPLSAFAATDLTAAPASITQTSCDYVTYQGSYLKYQTANSTVNSHGISYVFDEKVGVPGVAYPVKALCAYHIGTLGSGANGQRWNFMEEVTDPSLKAVLTYVYSCTNGDFTDAGKAFGFEAWPQGWADLWFIVAQSLTWYHEYGQLINYQVDRNGFLNQLAQEYLAVYKLYDKVYGWSPWITNWSSIGINDIINSSDGGATGLTAMDCAASVLDILENYPHCFHNYRLWKYQWDTTQTRPSLPGAAETPMQHLLIAVPEPEPTIIEEENASLTVKKLEAGTNRPLSGVTFKIESVNDPGSFSVTRATGADGTLTLTQQADNLQAGQYTITEVAAPAGYKAQTASQVVTVMPNTTTSNVFTFYNEPEKTVSGEGSIRKVDSDNPTKGIPGAVIKITSVKLDDGGSFTSTYTTGDGGYISKEDLDFSKLPTGSYLAEEITPPQGYVLSSDVSKVKQAFTWDGEHDVSLVFENSSKVKIQLKKVDENGNALAGAVFVVLRDGQIVSTEETKADGTITVSNVSEGYYEFREVSAPDGYDSDHLPVGVHVNAEDIQGEQTITVTKVNYHKRGLTIEKKDADSGKAISGAVFHIRGVNLAFEQDVTTGEDGKVTLPSMASGCYEVTETSVPSPYLVDTNNRKTVWIDAAQGQDVTVTFTNSTKPGLRLVKTDYETGNPIAGVTFLIEQVGGGYSEQHKTDANGLIVLDKLEPGAYNVTEVKPAPGYVADPLPHTVWLEKDHTTALELTNTKKPDLRILKYDQQSGKPLSGVTFEIWHDGKLFDTRKTDFNGEIFLSGLELGTYLVKEVATDDDHVVNSTPQQIELTKDRTEVAQLIFFNSLKPGIHLVKVDSVTMKSLPNVRFEVKKVGGSYKKEFTTDANGELDLSKLEPGAYEVRELEAPDGYLIDNAVRVVQINPDENANFVFTNTPKPSLRLIKVSSDGSPLAGVHFRIAKIEDGTHYLDRITDEKGGINISNLEPGVYSVKETATTANHILDMNEHHVELFAGQTSTIVLENQQRPNLTVYKKDADTGEPVPNTVFLVKAADGHSVDEIKTDATGKATLENLLPGVYEISEKSVPEPYLKDAEPQLVTLYANRDHSVYFENHKKPTLTVNKVDSITGNPIKGAKFQVWYGSNSTNTGELNDLGVFYSDENGQFFIDSLRDGWYKITELEPAAGFTIKQPATQEVYLKGGESKTVVFENVPQNAIIVEKYDSVTGEALPGCTFQLKYLGGTSGIGGTVIGTKVTGKNGTALWAGLNPGAYVLEEIDPADGYSILQASETVYLADNGEQSVITVRFKNAPDGNLLIRKVCATNPSVTLQNAEFKVMYADGTLIGDSNGIYRTDENGEIRITGLKPGKSVVVTEVKAPAGFIIDTQSQTIQVKEGRTVSLTFKNQPRGKLIIQKRDSSTNQPLFGAEFRITTAAGCEVGLDGVIGTSTLTSNGVFTTDAQGEIRITNLAPGAYVLNEIKAPDGYVIDNPSTNVVIGQGGDTQTVVVKNTKKATLTIEKYIEGTTTPIQGVTFLVSSSDGTIIGNSNGEFITDKNGKIVLDGLIPGTTITVKEIKTPDGYVLDSTPKSIKIKAGEAQTLRFNNQKQGGIIIKKLDSVTKEPLEGVEFQITYSDGKYVDDNYGHTSSKGLYRTDRNGEIRIFGIVGTLVIQETETIPGYVLNKNSQTVKVNADDVQTVTFYNTPLGGAEIIKVDASDKSKRLSGAKFEIRKANDALVDTVTTGKNGRVYVDLDAGNYYAVEIEAPKGYKLDKTPHYFTVKDGKTTTVTIENKPLGGILIHKTDSVTGKGLYGVTFLLYDSKNTPIGQYTSDNEGYVYIEGLADAGRYYLRELDNPGYLPDTQMKTVYVKAGETTTVEWKNTPVTAQIQITKKSADYNPTNGLPAGTVLEGAVFEIYDKASNLVDTIRSDKNGLASSKPLPLGRYTIREIKAPANYAISGQELTAYLEYAGEIVRFEVTNKSVTTSVAITKTGPNEVMPGQPVNYTFSNIGNTSSVTLESFYWRDVLPAEVRLNTVVTGTYNFPGTYKISYRVNGGEYRTLADNLSTSKNYTLDASSAALGLAANERVTEIMFVFGQAPSGFAQVEKPQLKCTSVTGMTSTSFTNIADVGGVYNGVWVQAITRWVTKVYIKVVIPTLPKTGY